MRNSEVLIFPIVLLLNLIQPGIPALLKVSLGFGLSHDPNDVRFYLYSSTSDPDLSQELIYLDDKSLENSNFQIGEKTVLLIHGFWSNSTSPFPTKVKIAYLKSSLKANYIVVEWGLLGTSPYAKYDPLYPLVYAEVVTQNVPIVGQRVADFLGYLESKNYIRLDALHLVGHSLGAHVSGWAGNLIQERNSGLAKVKRISGLDPAGPLFDGIMGLQRKLWQADAEFVDVYHTAMGTRGDSTVDGHVDFYPNGGFYQPPCTSQDFTLLDPFATGSCSHRFVADIFAATINKNFTACQCSSQFFQELFHFKSCLSCTSTVLAGEPCPSNTRGQYFFTTSSNP